MATHALASYATRAIVSGELTGANEPDQERERIALGGVLIDKVDFLGAVDRIRGLLASSVPHQIVTVNHDFLSIARNDAKFRRTLNAADLAVADGMPLIWASRL